MHPADRPEDSTLRRHYESAARFRHEAFLSEPPTDSVLRRHYAQLHAAPPAARGAARPQPAPKPAAAARPAPPPRPVQAPSPPPSPGFWGWLRRLFG